MAAPVALRAPGVRRRQQPAQVLVAAAVLDQQQHGRRRRTGDVTSAPTIARTPRAARRPEEPRRAVQAIHIGERERVVPPTGGRRQQILRQRGAIEKRERRPTAQLDIIGDSHATYR